MDLDGMSEVAHEMLKERFDRAVDIILSLSGRTDDALFALYDDGVLTKGDVKRRGNIPTEAFYDQLRAARLRRNKE